MTPYEGPHVWQSWVGWTVGRVWQWQTIGVGQTRQSPGKAWEETWEGVVPEAWTESEHVSFFLHVADDDSLTD